MNKIKAILYTIILSTFFKVGSVFAIEGSDYGQPNINPGLLGDTTTVDITAQKYIVYLMTFLVLAAVIYGIYGGFLILTAGEDEDKVKKGKTVIIYSLIGIVIIFLAGPIIEFFLGDSSGGGGIFTDD